MSTPSKKQLSKIVEYTNKGRKYLAGAALSVVVGVGLEISAAGDFQEAVSSRNSADNSHMGLVLSKATGGGILFALSGIFGVRAGASYKRSGQHNRGEFGRYSDGYAVNYDKESAPK